MEEERIICSSCGEDCEIGEIDEGVGGTNYGSSYSFHRDVQPVSQCCGETAIFIDDEGVETEITKSNLNELT